MTQLEERLTQALGQAEARIAELEEKNANLWPRLRNRVAELEDALSRASDAQVDALKARDEAQQRGDEWRAEAERCKRELTEARAGYRELERHILKLHTKVYPLKEAKSYASPLAGLDDIYWRLWKDEVNCQGRYENACCWALAWKRAAKRWRRECLEAEAKVDLMRLAGIGEEE